MKTAGNCTLVFAYAGTRLRDEFCCVYVFRMYCMYFASHYEGGSAINVVRILQDKAQASQSEEESDTQPARLGGVVENDDGTYAAFLRRDFDEEETWVPPSPSLAPEAIIEWSSTHSTMDGAVEAVRKRAHPRSVRLYVRLSLFASIELVAFARSFLLKNYSKSSRDDWKTAKRG